MHVYLFIEGLTDAEGSFPAWLVRILPQSSGGRGTLVLCTGLRTSLPQSRLEPFKASRGGPASQIPSTGKRSLSLSVWPSLLRYPCTVSESLFAIC